LAGLRSLLKRTPEEAQQGFSERAVKQASQQFQGVKLPEASRIGGNLPEPAKPRATAWSWSLFSEAGASTLEERNRRLVEVPRQSAASHSGYSSTVHPQQMSSQLGLNQPAASRLEKARMDAKQLKNQQNKLPVDHFLRNQNRVAARQDNQTAKKQVLSLLNHGAPAQARGKAKNTKADNQSVRESYLAEFHSRLYHGGNKPSSTSLGKGAMLLTDIMAPTSEASHSSNELGFFHSTARKGGAWILKKAAEVVKTSQDYLDRNPDVKVSLAIVSQLSGKLQELGFQKLDKVLGQDPVRGAKDRKEIAYTFEQIRALGLSKVTQAARDLGLNREDAAAVATAVGIVASAVLIKKAGLATIRGAQAATADASKALVAVKKGYQALPEFTPSTGGRMLNQYGFISPEGLTLAEVAAGKHAQKKLISKAQQGIGAPRADSLASALRLKAELAFKEAGLLDSNGKLTSNSLSVQNRIFLKKGEELHNSSVIKELTKNGQPMENWGKYSTKHVDLPNGQKVQVHYYYNHVTSEVNYTHSDFKITGVIKTFTENVKP